MKEKIIDDLKIDFYEKRGKERPRREHSVFHLKGVGDDHLKYPDWFYESRDKLKGKCLYCGVKLKNRRFKYCSDSCKWKSTGCHNTLQGTSARKYIHKRFNFKCCECGELFQEITPAGFKIPHLWGHVDHILPLADGGTDDVFNLQLLCEKCHKVKTIRENKQRASSN